MSFAMSRAEREAFLADVHIGVLTVARAGQGPLAVPVWYSYSAGGLVSVLTGRTSRKVAAIAAAGRLTLCAQVEAPPYKYVTVERPSVIEPAEQTERIALARRYLGVEGGDNYIAASQEVDEVMIRMMPEHWLSVDYSKRAS